MFNSEKQKIRTLIDARDDSNQDTNEIIHAEVRLATYRPAYAPESVRDRFIRRTKRPGTPK